MYQAVVLHDDNPFDEYCDLSICEEPIGRCSGTACPIECITECLPEETYYAVIALVDIVGLEEVYYAMIVLGPDPDCDIDVTEGWEIGKLECVDRDSVTTDTVYIHYY